MDIEDLEKQLNQIYKMTSKQGKYMEELEKDVAILKLEILKLKKDSHPISDFVCTECGCKAKRK